MSDRRPSASKTLASEGDTLGEADAGWGREVLCAGTEVGRYVITRLLGMGGMGAVYEALDVHLDRRIALKLVRLGRNEDAARRRRGRLQREAQAMAQLNHPNVVTINDVGSHGDQTYLAMELVEGCSLARWFEGRPGWREVLRVFLAAGRGLAAAHRAGLVHRDFKPHNVMLADDGRVLVTDFGLVRAATAAVDRATSSEDDSAAARVPISADALTRDGAFVGTPAYTAPEAFVAGAATERSDQFSFCVSLFEGLYGQRPFSGDTIGQLLVATSEGRVNVPETHERIPAHVRRAILRGLRPDPDRRYPSMDELLVALGRTRTRRPVIAAGLAVAAAASVAVVLSGSDDAVECGEGVVLWGENRAEPLRAALESADPDHAETAWPRIEQALADYASALQDARKATCDASQGHARVADLKRLCLQRREADLAGVIEALQAAEHLTHHRALRAVDALPQLELCTNPGGEDVPPDAVEEFTAVGAEIARLRARADAGEVDGGVEDARTLVDRARRLDHAATLGEALCVLGRHQTLAADIQGADASFSEAIDVAATAGADHVLAEAWILRIVGLAYGSDTRAFDLVPAAQAAVERTQPTLQRRIDFHAAAGLAAEQTGRHEIALGHFQEAVGLSRERGAPPKLRVLHGLGTALASLNRCREAAPVFEQELRMVERELGPDHPRTAYAWEGIGSCRGAAGDHAGAEEAFRKVHALRARQYGADSFQALYARFNLGMTLAHLKRHEEAIAALEAVVDPKARIPEGMDGLVASGFIALSRALLGIGELARAREAASRATVLAEMTRDVQLLMEAYGTLGTAHAANDELDAAIDAFEKGLDGRPGPRIQPRAYRDRCEFAANVGRRAGRLDDARAMLELCIGNLEASGAEANTVADLRALLDTLNADRARRRSPR